MDIYPLGHSSFRIKGKNATVVTDPFDPEMVGLKFPKVEEVDVVTVSHDHKDHDAVRLLPGSPFVVRGPGEYEVKRVTISGVSTWHDDKGGQERGKNVVYRLTIDGVNVCHLGDLGHKLTDGQVDEIGNVDVLFVPVGGFFTIDSKTAAAVVAQIEPRVVIPMHYYRSGMAETFKEKIVGVEDFLREMGAEEVVPVPKYGTSKERLPETTTVVVLE
ncbi:MAG: Zn-dependent hydrolase of the beta-lactamase fold-like protein [Microgenomates group bacterium GW2011_GWA1_48_10]|nr:MAG: Zn-dependent hydrolase of the beta-lactamase fold-like protein [Microgenomates group bacterium GW2011_GWA1_48_10]